MREASPIPEMTGVAGPSVRIGQGRKTGGLPLRAECIRAAGESLALSERQERRGPIERGLPE
jgi:hypothetical protein